MALGEPGVLTEHAEAAQWNRNPCLVPEAGSAVGEEAGTQEEGELVALVGDFGVGDVGVDEDELIVVERVGGEASLEFFRLLLRAAVVGVDIGEATVGAVGPREEQIGAAVERVEEPDLVGVLQQAAAVESSLCILKDGEGPAGVFCTWVSQSVLTPPDAGTIVRLSFWATPAAHLERLVLPKTDAFQFRTKPNSSATKGLGNAVALRSW